MFGTEVDFARVTGEPTNEVTKKAVCKSFTAVIRGSALAIDPKAFFMMLNANFPVLYQNNQINLAPIWDALSTSHAPEQLHGVFLMFRMRALDLGLAVQLPGPVESLSDDEMRLALQPWTGLMIPDEPTPYEPLPLALSTGDLKPFVPEELRRQIIQIVSTAFRASLSGQVDAAQLTFQIDSSFDALFDGQTFDLAQIFDGLRQSHPLSDQAIYQVVARATADLATLDVQVEEPALELNTIEKQNITADLRRAEERAAKNRASGPTPPAADKPPEETSKRITREERLKEYGLSSVREKRYPIRRSSSRSSPSASV